ncbi:MULTISPECIES: glutathione S-transferase family protein [Paraburkholderia]|jgi:glutathione S-transferase|uniref:glutathione transferase n=1 Tax=Paraburkholderia aspalathi TaxID=1324617 RepID=A0A1I7E2G6_9BURK|nr:MULTISPECIES: glutathione S-transferase [Paraburkholderia]MCP2089130.1 glutathione S-transferase [Paraburkholderia sediminicola]MBK3818742.1 glutathione S-transferase [Paraburkholderia aspalathi]MBK3830574.1 glutathione S-transferase [Paraburkholderia aspalathi]MBK3860296.1 glutathione S-transferase [Paraburkholderia aspalathi]MCX4137019.1 glutathione S-transferase [Paraburkholderia aspalathi]
MLTVHHLNNSRSQRVLWLLEELGVPYEIKRYERDPNTMLAPPELRAVHPLGKSPVITDDGQTLAESGAIIEYLVDKYGQGRFAPAAGTPERLRYTYWMHYAEGSAMPPLLLKLIALRIASAPMPFFAKPIARKIAWTLQSSFIDPQLKLHLGFINKELSATGWFVGNDFTAADVQMSFPLEAATARGGMEGQIPAVVDFLKRIHARPAYQRALERGGKYELLGGD